MGSAVVFELEGVQVAKVENAWFASRLFEGYFGASGPSPGFKKDVGKELERLLKP
jgi:hypothetical protein